MRKVYPSKASFSQYLPSMLTKIPWGLWGMRAEAHNIAIAWMQSVAVALIWWQRVWWISRVSWQTQQISGVLEVWSWWSSPSPPPSSSPTWAMIFPVLTARATSLHCWRSNRPKVVQFDICPAFTIEDVLLCVTVVMTNRNCSKQWHCRWRGVNIVVLRQFRMFLGSRPRASIQQLVTPWPPAPLPGWAQVSKKAVSRKNCSQQATIEGSVRAKEEPKHDLFRATWLQQKMSSEDVEWCAKAFFILPSILNPSLSQRHSYIFSMRLYRINLSFTIIQVFHISK